MRQAKYTVLLFYLCFHDKKNRNVRIIAGCNAGNFVETPVNTQHTLGSNNVLRLNCSARFDDPNTNQLEWVGRAVTENLTTNGVVKADWTHKYEIQGDFDLVFKDPELSDAGKYECRTNNESTEILQHNAQVIISGETCAYVYRKAHLDVTRHCETVEYP